MAKLFGMVMGISVMLLVLACAPQVTPVAAPATGTSQPASLVPAAVAPVSAEDEAWQKVVEEAKKEGRLTIYSYHLVGDVGLKVGQAFTKRTGLRLEIISGPSTSATERIKVERRTGVQIASVQTGNGLQLLSSKQEGNTQKLGNLPEFKKAEGKTLYDPWLDKDGHLLSMFQSTPNTWINTKLVPPGAEPRTWRDLLKPEWKGKIGTGNTDSDPGIYATYYGLTSRGKLDDAYFKQLGKQGLQSYPSSRMAVGALASGQIAVAIGIGTSTVTSYLEEGASLKAIDLAEGMVIQRSGGLGLIQGAPQPNAGRVFINWLFSQEGQTMYHSLASTRGSRKDVPNFEPLQAQFDPTNPIVLLAEDELEIVRIMRERVLSKILKGS